MKAALIFMTFVLANLAASDDGIEKELKEACVKESGFHGDLTTVEMEDMSKEAKCFTSCLLKKEGYLKKNGTFDMDSFKKDIEKEFAKETNEYVRVMEMCVSKVKPKEDLCEAAYDILSCQEKAIQWNESRRKRRSIRT